MHQRLTKTDANNDGSFETTIYSYDGTGGLMATYKQNKAPAIITTP